MGTPEFGAIILNKLIKFDFKPVLVVTSPDKPAGRRQIITPPPVKILAERNNIPVLQTEKIRNAEAIKKQMQELNPDLIIVASFGQIIPNDVLEMPKYKSINVHPSLLPKWRGASPVQFTLLSGDEKAGITIMQMAEKVDAGPILSQTEIGLKNDETYEVLHNQLGELGGDLLVKTIPDYIEGKILPQNQDETKATFSKIIKKDDGRINWQKSAQEIERQTRAFYPWPGSFTFWKKNNVKIMMKILKAQIQPQTNAGPTGIPGKTFLATNDEIAVLTGKDFLIIRELQLEGGVRIEVGEFLKGYLNFIGTVLE
jgi:methionyl-tRNA formyltransferase